MPENYQDLVFASFKEKQGKGELYPTLLKPTTAKLKKECLRIYDKRYTVQDGDILSMFFDVDKIGTDFRQIISKADPDDFRPLLNHLKEKTGKTDDKNSELLAWLIDFQPRPSTVYYRGFYEPNTGDGHVVEEVDNNTATSCTLTLDDNEVNTQENEKLTDEVKVEDIIHAEIEVIAKDENQGTKDEPVTLPQPFVGAPVDIVEPKVKSKFRNAIVLSVVIALAGGGSYAFLDNINAQCMYWTGDQYQSVGCSIKVDHATVIALDKEKLVGLKKINRLDTITEKDLGKVWYVKIKQDSAEFYTDSGTYPLNDKKRLMPMTPYILNKYILHK
jgi:hypothetical protein